ncbi:MAG: HU family DNA-binding protein [Myxococcales bacterium]|nr:integration host factor subunit beta [Myxococcota bacterium]MDW8281293.1 HU family DNA-binding protein [Myxococcales bacterium]
MTKSDLIEVVAGKLQIPKGKAEQIVNCIFDSMEESLRRGQRIEIRGFGSFEIRRYKAYEGRNPRTGDPVGVQPKKLPFFKVGKELKERVNAALQHNQSAQRNSGDGLTRPAPSGTSTSPRSKRPRTEASSSSVGSSS